jgi:hypothetical protein
VQVCAYVLTCTIVNGQWPNARAAAKEAGQTDSFNELSVEAMVSPPYIEIRDKDGPGPGVGIEIDNQINSG